jgi:hypothetical protein
MARLSEFFGFKKQLVWYRFYSYTIYLITYEKAKNIFKTSSAMHNGVHSASRGRITGR